MTMTEILKIIVCLLLSSEDICMDMSRGVVCDTLINREFVQRFVTANEAWIHCPELQKQIVECIRSLSLSTIPIY